MKKKMRGVGLLVLMLSCGVVSLAEDVIPTSTPQKCFYFDTGTNTITGYKFSDPDCPRDVVIPNEITVTGEVYEVKELGKNSFSHTNYTGYLHSVVMPTTLKKIGEQAFAGQHNIHTIKFNEGLEEIDRWSFAVGTMDLSWSIRCDGDNTLRGVLKAIDFPSTLKTIGNMAFACQSLTWLILPDSVTDMGDWAFLRNQLQTLQLPKNISRIPMQCFKENQLTEVMIPDSVIEIWNSAFKDNQISNLELWNKIEKISDFSFWNNELKEVMIPDSVIEIWNSAFKDNQISNLELSKNLKKIGKSAFFRNQLMEIKIPDSVTDLWSAAFRYNKLTKVKIGKWIKVLNNSLFADNELKEIEIPEGIEKLDIGVFYNNKFEEVGIPNSLKEIGKRVFDGNPWTWADNKVAIYMNRPETDPVNPRPSVENNSYANLIYKTFTIKFNLDGGTWAGATTLTGFYGDPLKSKIENPIKTWHIFSGWTPSLPEKIKGDQDFTAQWKEKSTSSSSWGGYSWGGGSSHSSTSSSSSSTSTPSTEQKKPETPVKNEPVKTEQVKTEIFNPTIQTTCFNPLDKQTIDQGNKISELLRIAHQMLYSYSLTKWQGTKDFAPERSLTREEAARFMTEFATNVLCRKASRTYNDHFTDLEKVNPELLPYIKKSYEYLIFNGDSNAEGKKEKTNFRPKELITVGELSAIMTRLVRNELLEEVEWDRSKNYRTYINAITPKSDLKNEVRGTVAEVIYDLYRNNDYELKDIGYVIKK